MTVVSVGITTRNRPRSLEACLRSIHDVLGPGADVLVFDDRSEVPVEAVTATIGGLDIRVLRDEGGASYIAGRNQMVREARHDFVLLLDDDTLLLERAAIEAAVQVLNADPHAGAIGFAQAERDGRPWPSSMQPAQTNTTSRIPAYIGFAHMIRRSAFLEAGGYRERLVFYGEEKDFCLRLLAEGYHVVYLPHAFVAHVPDPAGRDERRYVRYAIRNDCLSAFYNQPLALALAALPIRLMRYRRMARGLPQGDPGGARWLATELAREVPVALRRRTNVGWRVLSEWRRLKSAPAYAVPPGR